MPARSALLDGDAIQAVHDDFEHRVHAVGQLARDAAPSAQRRTVGVVGGRDHLLVASSRRPCCRHAPRRRETAARRRGPCASPRPPLPPPRAPRPDRRQNQEVAAADRPLNTERLLDQELALHHRDPPVAVAIEELARLVPVAEMPELSADDDSLRRLGQAVEARRGRAREHGLAHAIDEPAAEPFRVEAEDEHADAQAGRRASPRVGDRPRCPLRPCSR